MGAWLRKRARPIAGLLAFAILLVAALDVIGLIPEVQAVQHNGDQAHAEEPASYDFFYFAFLWVIGFINQYNGVVTAVATGFIAWFTVTLTRVGRDQHEAAMRSNAISRRSVRAAREAADAATLQARAAIGVELPVLVLDQVRLVSEGPVDVSLVDPRFEVTIKNFGRTPAFLTKSGADTYVGRLPDRPTWLQYFDLDSTVVIEQSHPYTMETIRRERPLNPVEVDQVMNGGYLWICWFIVYRDFLGRRAIYRDARRLYVMAPSGIHVFIDEAPEAYRGTAFVADDGTVVQS